MNKSNDFFYNMAVASMAASVLTILIVSLSVPMLTQKLADEVKFVEEMSISYKSVSDKLWAQLTGNQINTPVASSILYFSRRPRSPYFEQTCKGCNQLSCPSGLAGDSGIPGLDGAPGNAGNPGKAGEDGFDIELEPADDLPCSLCPAGPPGPRGNQGERGLVGNPGFRGEAGSPGNPGLDGIIGNPGKAGVIGEKGLQGNNGEPGNTVVAGVGIKGPKGPPGSNGPRGSPGGPGKVSKIVGMPGENGERGLQGPQGKRGTYGRVGDAGMPGEPGVPASYCPSDCGVSQILAPAIPYNMNANPSPSLYESKQNTEELPYYMRKNW
uniref:Col_cuticle_N domain-containing protein n=1 Tax=Rhabditophanes sp. KR3021 TaxID=114890 RepID=A0AC35U9W2_9BILA